MRKLLLILAMALVSCDAEDLCDSLGYTQLNSFNCLYGSITNSDRSRNDLNAFVDIFYDEAFMYGISLPPRGYVDVEFGDTGSLGGGVSYGKCNDATIRIDINEGVWSAFNDIQRLGLMYHELGHDVLNLDHSSLGIMLAQSAGLISSGELFLKEKDLMFKDYKARRFNTSRVKLSCPIESFGPRENITHNGADTYITVTGRQENNPKFGGLIQVTLVDIDGNIVPDDSIDQIWQGRKEADQSWSKFKSDLRNTTGDRSGTRYKDPGAVMLFLDGSSSIYRLGANDNRDGITWISSYNKETLDRLENAIRNKPNGRALIQKRN